MADISAWLCHRQGQYVTTQLRSSADPVALNGLTFLSPSSPQAPHPCSGPQPISCPRSSLSPALLPPPASAFGMKFKTLTAAARVTWPSATSVASLGAQFSRSLCKALFSFSKESGLQRLLPSPVLPQVSPEQPCRPGSAEGPPQGCLSQPVPGSPSCARSSHVCPRGNTCMGTIPAGPAPGVRVPGSPGPITMGVPWGGGGAGGGGPLGPEPGCGLCRLLAARLAGWLVGWLVG